MQKKKAKTNARIATIAIQGLAGIGAKEAINSLNIFNKCLMEISPDARIVLLPNKSTTKNKEHGFDGWLEGKGRLKRDVLSRPYWTTMFAHAKANSKMPKTIECIDKDTGKRWVFDVPDNAVGEKNIILAVNHGFNSDGSPLIKLHEEKGSICVEITDMEKIAIVENFPVKEGWYKTGNAFGIPTGKEVFPVGTGTRLLFRVEDEKIGLMARANHALNLKNVYFCIQPSTLSGVLALAINTAKAQLREAAKAAVDVLKTAGFVVPFGIAKMAVADDKEKQAGLFMEELQKILLRKPYEDWSGEDKDKIARACYSIQQL